MKKFTKKINLLFVIVLMFSTIFVTKIDAEDDFDIDTETQNETFENDDFSIDENDLNVEFVEDETTFIEEQLNEEELSENDIEIEEGEVIEEDVEKQEETTPIDDQQEEIINEDEDETNVDETDEITKEDENDGGFSFETVDLDEDELIEGVNFEVALQSGGSVANEVSNTRPELTGCNYNSQSYANRNWTSPVYSYLVNENNRYMLIRAYNGTVFAMYYTYDYKFIQSIKITDGLLNLFGGFYEGSDAYYILTGQNNLDEDNSKEVFKINKYDKNWNFINSVSLKGANTTRPFRAGTARFTEIGNYLVIRTSHEMYADGGGVNHQANVTISINKNTMGVVYSNTSVSNNSTGYVSHSMNQFVITDNNKVITVDHGDGAPRSIVLMDAKINKDTGKREGSTTRVSLLDFYGASGDNVTRASVGGVVASSSNYLVVYESKDQSNSLSFPRNVYLAIVDKSLTTEVRNIAYTNTTFDDIKLSYLSTPHIVKINDNDFMILYTSNTAYSSEISNSERLIEGVIHYFRVDENGNIIHPEKTINGALTDCVPIVRNNKVVWYIQDGKYVDFYEIDLSTDNASFKRGAVNNPVYVESINLSKDNLVLTPTGYNVLSHSVSPENASDPRITYTVSNPEVASAYFNNNNRLEIIGKKKGKTTVIVSSLDGHAQKVINVSVYDRKYVITYNNGNKDVTLQYFPGEKATISFYEVTTSRVFEQWEGLDDVTFTDGTNKYTKINASFIMPEKDLNPVGIYRIKLTKVTFENSVLNLDVGDQVTNPITYYPEDAKNKELTYTSTNTAVATVDASGKIKAVAGGTAKITAASKETPSVKTTCTVNVREYPSSVTLNKSTTTLNSINSYETLTATTKPTTATEKTLTWTSSNENIVTVNQSGRIIAIGYGEATITVSTVNGKSATCLVKVGLPVKSVSLDTNSLQMGLNDTGKLIATVSPSNAMNKAITWSSSKPSIVSVDNDGNLSALKTGTSVITVTTKDGGYTATCKVTVVKPVEVTSITIDSKLDVGVNRSVKLVPIIKPDTATNKNVTWTSQNESIATVDSSGYVRGVFVGTTTITATTHNGLKATCKVTVSVMVSYVDLDRSYIEMNINDEDTLICTVVPSDATNQSIIWTSSNPSVVSVDDYGNITALAGGYSTITATSASDSSKYDTCTVTVSQPVTSLKLNKTSLSLDLGESETLSSTILPDDAANKSLKWTSDNTSVATVSSSGKVIAKAVGTATITAKTTDGSNLSAKCSVTVTELLDTPEITFIRNNNYGVLFTFTPVEDADYYEIYRKDNTYNKKYSLYTTVTDTEYTDPNVEAGITYYYQIKAVNDKTYSKLSPFKKICHLTAPEPLKVSNTSKGVKVEYGYVEGSSWYRIYRRASNETEWTRLGETTKLFYYDNTAEKGKTYYYIVRAIRGNYYSGYLSKPVLKIVVLDAPFMQSLTQRSYYLSDKTEIEISYSSVTGASKYRIYRKDNDGNSSFKKIADTTSLTYVDNDVKSGFTYTYVVRAVKGSYTSAKSNEIQNRYH